jgi:hypothetical protein
MVSKRTVNGGDAQFIDVEAGDTTVIRGKDGARVVIVQSALATRIADLTSRLNDMKTVSRYCARYVSMADDPNAPEELKDALFEATLIRYGRAFANDVRQQGQLKLKALEILPGDPQSVHHHFLSIRNKFIAHSENPYEDVVVGVTLAEYPHPRGVTGAQVTHVSANKFMVEGAEFLGRMAEAFVSWGMPIAAKLQSELAHEAQQLDIDVVYALPDATYTMPHPEQASERRTRPQDYARRAARGQPDPPSAAS